MRRAQHRATTPPHGNEPVWASGKDTSYVRCFGDVPPDENRGHAEEIISLTGLGLPLCSAV